jgi:hypothetical protein
MITQRTLLVVGAGASHPYGYPLGTGLVDRIVAFSGQEGGLRRFSRDERLIDHFNYRLSHSDVGSIDAFLEANPEFADLGKLAIAATLTILGPPHDHVVDGGLDWYRYLWGRMHEGAKNFAEFKGNQIRVLTYNYDSSLERYLERVLGNYYTELGALEDGEIRKLAMTAVPVLHVHGDLAGVEDTILPENDRSFFFGSDLVHKAARGIRIVHEGAPDATYKLAHEWLRWADNVYFLGFGYHPTNLGRLRLPEIRNEPKHWARMMGTGYGMMNAEMERAFNNSGRMITYIHPLDSLAFLRTHAPLI